LQPVDRIFGIKENESSMLICLQFRTG